MYFIVGLCIICHWNTFYIITEHILTIQYFLVRIAIVIGDAEYEDRDT